MDEETLALLIYLDEGLVKNLSSLFLSGYIDIRTTKLTQDRTLIGSAGYNNKKSNFGEDRYFEEERQGFKGNNCSKVEQLDTGNSSNANLENREFIRKEEEIKTIYTTFSLHSQILTSLSSAQAMRTFNNRTITAGEVVEGEYVKIQGKLTTENINSYLDCLLSVFNCFGCESLDSIIADKKESLMKGNVNKIMNFKVINTMINHLNDLLNKNSTEDMIMTCGDTTVVINVNDNFFMNNNSYIFDKVDCPCTVFGKVIKVANSGECISLLRKTAQHDFYEKVLNSCLPYCEVLSENGVIIPTMPRLSCSGVSLIVVPVSICM